MFGEIFEWLLMLCEVIEQKKFEMFGQGVQMCRISRSCVIVSMSY